MSNVSLWSPAKLWEMRACLRLSPFDESTEKGRSMERYRRLLLSAGSTLLGRLVGGLSVLISIPLTVRYLGAERYGVWVTISSLVLILGSADLGIGNGLVNAISRAAGRAELRAVSGAVSSAWFCFLSIFAVLLLVMAGADCLVDWGRVFNVQDAGLAADAGIAFNLAALLFALGIPLSTAYNLQRGLQESYLGNLWLAAGNLAGFLLLLAALWLRAGLPLLVLVLSSGPLLGHLANHIHQFHFRRPDLRPTWTMVELAGTASLLREGFLFFILQLVGAAAFGCGGLIITQLLGPGRVMEYAVPQRAYQLVISVLAAFSAPLWAAFGEALARRDYGWARSALWRMSLGSLAVAAVPCVFMGFFGNWVLHCWVGSDAARISPDMLWALSLWTCVTAFMGPVAMLLNGARVVRFQIITASLFGVASVLLSFPFVRLFGPSGVVWALLLGYIPLNLVPCLFYLRSFWRMAPTLQEDARS